jgi:histidine ammonia-lyase
MTPRESVRRHADAYACAAVTVALALFANGANGYVAVDTTLANQTITLTGHDLSIDQIVAVARHGAKVAVSSEAQQREADNYGLLLEAASEGVQIYGFNRGAGDQREVVIFKGDPLSPENKATIERLGKEGLATGATIGFGPEVDYEDIVRAMMVVRANEMTFSFPSPALAQMLIDLLNKRVTPVVQSRGTVGEGDLAQTGAIGGTMIGLGDVYYQGQRMPASKALAAAGLRALVPSGDDVGALISSDAYATGQAALLVYDAQHALEWADLAYAMDLNAMNSSVTPLALVVQCDRPEQWLNWHARRMLDVLKGSYLFADDRARIIQDPESLRASSIRQASAWEDWAALRDAVVRQVNSSDHNPAIRVGVGPNDSWELATPQLLKYYVKGGPHSHGQHGFVLSNANWDPYPMANRLESFVIALANMDVAVLLRIDRFKNPFFTVAKLSDVIPGQPEDWGYAPVALEQEVQSLTNPVAPLGSAIVSTVEDLQAQTYIKVTRGRQAVSTTLDLLAFDLTQAALWLDVRKRQDATRTFGAPATAVWQEIRRLAPLHVETDNPPRQSLQSDEMAVAAFIHATGPASFYSGYPPSAKNAQSNDVAHCAAP